SPSPQCPSHPPSPRCCACTGAAPRAAPWPPRSGPPGGPTRRCPSARERAPPGRARPPAGPAPPRTRKPGGGGGGRGRWQARRPVLLPPGLPGNAHVHRNPRSGGDAEGAGDRPPQAHLLLDGGHHHHVHLVAPAGQLLERVVRGRATGPVVEGLPRHPPAQEL